MIPVQPAAEPPSFDSLVRQRGARFLRGNGRPTARQFKKHAYWKDCIDDLRVAYGGICAYSSMWVAALGSVDHFQSKGVRPDLAYEWSNYRFAAEKLNGFKGNSADVLDPFQIQPGWFALDLSTFFVLRGIVPTSDIGRKVDDTIRVLRLNDDSLVRQRFHVAKDYADGDVTLAYLERRYPFIAFELKRQQATETIKGKL
jgi:hypothetical protein